ncbi:MAG: hypothetical protein AAGM22_31210, partial [Acidobacteriota bacterium]
VPAVWVSSPALAIAIGQALAAFYFFAPAALWLRTPSGRSPVAPVAAVAAFVFLAAVSLDLWSLRYVALTVHADGPALACGALAAWCLWRWRATSLGLGTAALLSVTAVWTKQVAVGVPLGLALFVAAAFGVSAWVRFAAWGAAWSAASWGVVIWLFGAPSNVLFHLVHVPGQHRWLWGGGARALRHSAGLFLRENVTVLALAVAAAALGLTASRGQRWPGLKRWLIERPWPVLLTLAVCQFPLAIMGRAKIGGDVNAFSHCLYFLLLAVALAVRDLAFPPPGAAPQRWSRLFLVGAPVLILLTVAGLQDRSGVGPALGADPHPYTVAARFAADHPGKVYFPRMNLVTGLVEGRIDHQSEGVVDLINAGYPPTSTHFAGRLPPEVEFLVIYLNGMTEQVAVFERYFELVRLPDHPELPGFWIYRATLRGPDQPPAAASP